MADHGPERFRRSYAALSDQELLSLDQTSESLLPQARHELEEELNRRRIGQNQKDEFRSTQEISRKREAQLQKRTALVRRRWIEDWFTSTTIMLMGSVLGGLVWFVARHILVVPPGRAKLLAMEIGVAATIVSGLIGVVILHRRQRWRKLRSRRGPR